MKAREKITPCLWFDGDAEEAAKFYISVFGGSIRSVSHYGKNMHMPEGTPLLVEFDIDGRQLQALNGGPQYKFTPALSLSVTCADQEEVDRLWKGLTADGGREVQCGWLQDKYGLSWQIVPARMIEIMEDPDKQKVGRAMAAMMQMIKLDVAKLEAAYAGTDGS